MKTTIKDFTNFVINKISHIKEIPTFVLIFIITYINAIFKLLTKNNEYHFIIFSHQPRLTKQIKSIIFSKRNKSIIRKRCYIFDTQLIKKKERFKLLTIYLQRIKQINIKPVLLIPSNLKNTLFSSSQIDIIFNLHFIFIPIYFFKKNNKNNIKPINVISIYQFIFDKPNINKKALVKLFAYKNFIYLYLVLLLKKYLKQVIIKQVLINKKQFFCASDLAIKKILYETRIRKKRHKKQPLKKKYRLAFRKSKFKNKIWIYRCRKQRKKVNNIIPFILLYTIFFKPNKFLSYNIKKKYRLAFRKNKFKNKILKNKTSGRRKQQRKWPQIYKKIRLLKRIRLSIKKKKTRAEIYKSYYRNRIKIRLFINKAFKHTLISKIVIKENYIKKNIRIKQLNLFLSFLLVRLLVIPTLYIAFFLIKKHYIIINGLIIKNPYYVINVACLNIITISYFSQRILFISRQYKRLTQYRLQEKYIFKVKRRKWNPKRYLKYIRWRRFEQLFRYPNSKGTTIPLIYNKKYTKIQILQAVNYITYRKIFYNTFLQYNCYINYYKGYHTIRRKYKKLYSSIISKRPHLKFIRLIKNKFINKFPYGDRMYLLIRAKHCTNWLQKIKKQYKNKTTNELLTWYIKNVLNKKKINNFINSYFLFQQNNNLNKKVYQKLKNYIIKIYFYNIIKYIKQVKKITLQIRLIKKLFYTLYKHWNRIKIEIIYLDRLQKRINVRKFKFNVILINYYQVKLYTPNLNNKYYLNAYFIINIALKKINLFRKQNRKFRYIARFVYHSRYYKPQRDYNRKFRGRFRSNNAAIDYIIKRPIVKDIDIVGRTTPIKKSKKTVDYYRILIIKKPLKITSKKLVSSAVMPLKLKKFNKPGVIIGSRQTNNNNMINNTRVKVIKKNVNKAATDKLKKTLNNKLLITKLKKTNNKLLKPLKIISKKLVSSAVMPLKLKKFNKPGIKKNV
jgi:hypothetical protein